MTKINSVLAKTRTKTKTQSPDNSPPPTYEHGRNTAIRLAETPPPPISTVFGESKTFDGNLKNKWFQETPVSLSTHLVIQIVLALHQSHVCIWILPVALVSSNRQLVLWNLKAVLARTHYGPIHRLSVVPPALPNQFNNYQLSTNKISDANT